MKKTAFIILLIIASGIVLHAQDDLRGRNKEHIKEKVESKKIAFLSDKLDLSPTEAQIFWPIYNAYQDELMALRNENVNTFMEETNAQNAEIKLQALFEMDKEHLKIKQAYADKMKVKIGAEKTLNFFKYDKEFKSSMIRGLKEKREKRFRKEK